MDDYYEPNKRKFHCMDDPDNKAVRIFYIEICKSNNSERLSSDNGLLLSATYDRLFDSGLISFDNSGKILVSHYIDNANKSRLKLDNQPSVNIQFSTGTKHNLEYHRDIVFLK